ncbi:MAG: ribosome silencing factor [Bacteroidia bacterium]|jgi:ribosome-associated protein|nr:ribosome silencing factor [Bacteroidia bacterium]
MAKTARAAIKSQKTAIDLLTEAVIRGLQDRKAKDIKLMDLRGISSAVSDFFIVCHGESSTQVEGLARNVEQEVEKETGEIPAHIEGTKNAQWVLIDYISVVVHIFQPEQRSYYGIERLWADAEIRDIESN